MTDKEIIEDLTMVVKGRISPCDICIGCQMETQEIDNCGSFVYNTYRKREREDGNS